MQKRFKKMFGAILAVSLLCSNDWSSMKLAVAAETNLVSDYGFEQQGRGWYELGADAATNIVLSGAAGTEYALQIGTGEGGLGQKIDAVAGTEYTLTGYGRVSTAGEVGYLGVDCLDRNGNRLTGGKFEVEFKQTNYQKKEMTFTAIAGTAQIQIYTYKNPGNGYAYMDEIALIPPMQAEEIPSQMSNMDFETGDTNWYELGENGATNIVWGGAGQSSHALQIGTGEGGLGQKTAAVAGREYTLTGFGKVSMAGEVGYLGVDCMDSKGNRLAGGKFEVQFTGTQYEAKSVTFTTVAGTTQIQVYTYKNPGGGYAYIDEIEIAVGTVGGAGNQGSIGLGAEAFFDDFNGTTVDTTIWQVVDQKWGSGNNGVKPENVSVQDGYLVIRADGDLADVPRVGGCLKTVGDNYASGSYEVRMKAVPQMGALTAMWTYYNDGTMNHEIDIEMPGNRNSFDYVLCTDWIQAIETDEYRTSQLIPTATPQDDGEFHVYRFDWHTDPARVDYYRDGVLLTSQTTTVPDHAGNFWLGVWFPNNWSGDPDFATDYLYVDYVKFTPFNESGDVY